MGGSLIKRGHNFLSMRKRYCVLVRIELSFYVTHDAKVERRTLSWNCNQRCEMDNASETEHDRRLRDQFSSKLADFYRVRDPLIFIDLDLLLCSA
ncbi:putative PH-like domain superfamily protein [Plasmopara halstedii]